MNHLNLESPLKQAHMKPEKPEDRDESWLRKMADRLPRRRSQALVKEEPEEEDEQESVDPTIRSPRKPKKKAKKDDGCTWPVFIFFALAAYGAWKILVAVFG
jgi:hypothetical protein